MRAVLAILVAGCGGEAAVAQGIDGCPPVVLAGDPATPTSLVVENGRARVSYPGGVDGADPGGHRLEVLAADGWRPATLPSFLDYPFFTSPWRGPAARAYVLTESPELVELSFVWDHTFDAPGGYGGCYLPGCGVVYRDVHGAIIYDYDRHLDAPRIRTVRFWKVIGMRACEAGYYVGQHSDPPLAWGAWLEARPRENSLGERELGFGPIAVATWSSAGDLVRNPAAGGNVELGVLEQAVGPWWFAAIPAPSTGLRVIPFLVEEHPMHTLVAQFGSDALGVPMVHFMNPQLGLDGRNERYQAFFGAVPYDATDPAAEPTAEARALVLAHLPSW